MVTYIPSEVIIGCVVVAVSRTIRREDMRRSLDEHDVPAFHHALGGRVVDAIGRAVGALAT